MLSPDAIQFRDEDGATLGSRLKEAREHRKITQRELSNLLDISRSAVALWETDKSFPPIPMIPRICELLKCDPEWLTFGIRSRGPHAERKFHEDTTILWIKEVLFGESPDDRSWTQDWALSRSWIEQELKCSDPKSLILFRVADNAHHPVCTVGDRILVDTTSTSPTSSGHFLQWDGNSPAINRMISVPQEGDPLIRVYQGDSSEPLYEVPLRVLKIIGRVRAIIKNM